MAVEIGGLRVEEVLYDLVRNEIAPGTDVDPDAFWTALGEIVRDLGPGNRELLDMRDRIQEKMDGWYRERKGRPIDAEEYRSFLTDIGYLAPEGDHFELTTARVDPEIATVAGPQLVVPVDNARYALNAANARWGSLYDALYGTNVIPEEPGAEKGEAYNPVRGAKVIDAAEAFLDDAAGLASGRYSEVTRFAIVEEDGVGRLVATLRDGRDIGLANPDQFRGYRRDGGDLSAVLLVNNGLHIEIRIDRSHPVGAAHPAGVRDVLLEAAVTTIQDCEDSVSAVDAEDKALVYGNWNGIMRGTLETTFEKGGRQMTRRLSPDRKFTAPDGGKLTLPCRSLLLVRNVGIHMYTDSVTTAGREEIPEGFLDAMVTALAAKHDLKRQGEFVNSGAGSIYIVKPKLHGPEEVAATIDLFERVEAALGLERNTIKIGIMDEERRTTVNLKAAIRQARDRVVFINTGFLDRTGDEIHTSMEAGPMHPKADIRAQPWLAAYEDWNVDVGVETGFSGRGQIGKGMWTMPDEMRDMVETKIGHPGIGGQHRMGAVSHRGGAARHALSPGGRGGEAGGTCPARAGESGRNPDAAAVGPGSDGGRDPAGAGQQCTGYSGLRGCGGWTRAWDARRYRISTTWD